MNRRGDAHTRDVAAANANGPASGWASLTPTERDLVSLVGEGLANKDIGRKAFRVTADSCVPPHARLHQDSGSHPGFN